MNQEKLLEKGMPASLDAERSILGAILLAGDLFGQSATMLNPDDFSLDSHRRIYRAMEQLMEAGNPVDLVTLSDALARKKELEAIGGVTYLSTLTEGLPRRDNIEHYVKIVRDNAVLRAIIHMSNSAIACALDQTETADEVLQTVQQRLIEIVQHEKQGSLVEVKEAARETFQLLESIRRSERKCIGVPTGLDDLDDLTTGFREKEFYVVGARPGQGKTALMCQSTSAAIAAAHKPGVFSVEVDRTQIITRLACQLTGLEVFDTRDPSCMGKSEFAMLTEAIAEIGSWPWFLEDSPRMSIKQLHAIARLWVSKGCDCIFVDYLQKLRAPGKTEYERVTAIADGLWELARMVEIPVVALSQLRRLGNGEKDRPPMLDDLRSSGEIEQNANAAFLIWRPLEPDDDGINHYSGEDQIIIAKQRSGPAGTHVKVRFDGPVGKFQARS